MSMDNEEDYLSVISLDAVALFQFLDSMCSVMLKCNLYPADHQTTKAWERLENLIAQLQASVQALSASQALM